MSGSISQIIDACGELFVSVKGVAQGQINVVRPLNAPVLGCLTFAKDGLDHSLLRSPALTNCVIICKSVPENPPLDRTWVEVSNPRLAFMRVIAAYFMPPRPTPGIHPTAVVASSAMVDPTASIGAYTVVGHECVIGADVVLHPHVTLYSSVKVGSRTVINSGCVIGADGFGYERNAEGLLEKFVHVGGVVIGDEVEIGSNTSIDRGTLGDTVIEDRVRIDNQCHVSHNVHIGADSAVIAQSMLGGSVSVGRGCWIAPAAVVMNQIKVGDGATVGMAAVVVKNVPCGSTVTGSPAVDIAEFRANRKLMRALLESMDSGSSV